MRRLIQHLFPFTLGFVLALPFLPATLYAQGPADTITQSKAASCKLGWDQAAADLATAQAFVYKAVVDGGAQTTVTATCSGGSSPFTCETPLPVQTVGTHTVQVFANALDFDGVTLVPSGGSPLYTIAITPDHVTPPAAPTNLRLIKILGILAGIFGLIFAIHGA
jgi:hypothetical protein